MKPCLNIMSFNDNFSNLYKKVERLSSGVFLVSSIINDSLELRTKIRHLAIDLISDCSAIKDSTPDNKIKIIAKMGSNLVEMASFVDMACLAGLVSEMNSSILKQEFDLLMKNLDELSKYFQGKVEINNDFFKLNNDSLMLPDGSSRDSHKQDKQEFIKDNKIKQKDKGIRKEIREKAIIDFVKAKGSVNIKDISRSIKGCSAKTIQRRLISLMNRGIIKREGERRWSRYLLQN